MPTIKADGVATLVHLDAHGRRSAIGIKSWFVNIPFCGYCRLSRKLLSTESEAIKYGKRVAERFNRIFGKAAKDVQP